MKADVDHFVRRLLQQCLAEATAAWWERRAEDFDRARPKPEEFHGQASPVELSRRDKQLTAVAQACRARATLARQQLDAPEVDQVLEEVET